MAGLLSAFVVAWQFFDEIPLVVIGQPTASGRIQKDKEEPFFRTLRAKTAMPFRIDYRPVDTTGLKDTYALKILKQGKVDLVSLRFTQNSSTEPSLQGIDLLGIMVSPKDSMRIMIAYSKQLDQYLQSKYNAKLLGVWTFGPQELFCRRPVNKLLDIKGRNVRVASEALNTFIWRLGGRPVVIPFEETNEALKSGLLDCAITSSASANFSGWPQHAKYNFPLPFQTGLNGYVISLSKWNRLSRERQRKLQSVFDDHVKDVWRFSEVIMKDAIKCNTGASCKSGTSFQGERARVSSSDTQLFRQMVNEHVLPQWGLRCEKVHPGCIKAWSQTFSSYWQSPNANRFHWQQ